MILSVSRRTDIPAYYSDWFFNRVDEGYVLVRNPMNYHQVSRIRLSPDVLDCIVFWSKNPRPMLPRLAELKKYPYYFQYTINAYGTDLEPGMPALTERIDTFREIADRIGPERVIWRYDPVIVNDLYPVSFHLEQFGRLALELRGYTKQCVISFVDTYRKLQSAFRESDIRECSSDEVLALAAGLAGICRDTGIRLATCAEKTDLSFLGIEHARCIDGDLISRIIGKPLNFSKDRNQRPECGCAASTDIGQYNTCPAGCVYCYANYNSSRTAANYKAHDPASPLLIGSVGEGDRITERNTESQSGGNSLWNH